MEYFAHVEHIHTVKIIQGQLLFFRSNALTMEQSTHKHKLSILKGNVKRNIRDSNLNILKNNFRGRNANKKKSARQFCL